MGQSHHAGRQGEDDVDHSRMSPIQAASLLGAIRSSRTGKVTSNA